MSRVERIGDCVLILGDWRDADFGGASCVLTDPPYGKNYRSGYATKDLWSEDSIRNDENTLERDDAAARFEDLPQLIFGTIDCPAPAKKRATLIWDKGPALGMGALDLPWKPSFELIYVLGKGFIGPRDEGAVLYCPPVQSMAQNGRVHPNQKPVPLLQRLLKKMPIGTVADPFMGSGSTGVACVTQGRPFIGTETDPRYFAIAVNRIRDAYAQPDFFVPALRRPPQQQALGL